MAEEKRYNTFNKQDIELTTRNDEIANDDIGEFRAILSCGHACDPNSLTHWCRNLLEDGKCEFVCPALNDKDTPCSREWSYDEVRRLGMLTAEEMESFESKLNENRLKSAGARYRQCPDCSSFVERDSDDESDHHDLRTECIVCKSVLKRSDYIFCWQCEQPCISGVRVLRGTCGRLDCRNKDLDVLANCFLVKLKACPHLPQVPSIRGCPKCGKLVEHNTEGCKNVICSRCQLQFCFACLETTETCQKSSPGLTNHCAKPVQPRQASLSYITKKFS